MNQVGEAEWNRMNERERQRKLMEIKMQERRLREEGKLDEAKELLKGLIDAEQGNYVCVTYQFLLVSCHLNLPRNDVNNMYMLISHVTNTRFHGYSDSMATQIFQLIFHS